MLDFIVTVLPFLLIIGAWIADAVFGIYCKLRNSKFEKFLEQNRDELLCGNGCEFYGFVYTGDTMLVRYRVCVSVIALTSSNSTSFFPAAGDNKVKILCNVITLLGGWWGFPWGPIETVKTFKHNSDPDMCRIRDLYSS